MRIRLLLVLSAACLLLAPARAAETINDERIQQELSGKGAALLKQKPELALSNLVAQLTRRRCELDLPPCSTNRLDTPALCERAKQSVVVVGGLYKCKRCSEWHTVTATAFAIAKPDIFLTNFHVVDEDKATVLVARSVNGRVAGIAEVLAANRPADFAIVRIPGLELPPLPLRAGAAEGSPIAVISHPDHRFFSFTGGYISRYFAPARKEHTPRTEWMQVTADFAKGSSGGPALDECGNVVGMVASTQAVYYDEKNALTAQMVFHDCVPMAAVLAAIDPAKRR